MLPSQLCVQTTQNNTSCMCDRGFVRGRKLPRAVSPVQESSFGYFGMDDYFLVLVKLFHISSKTTTQEYLNLKSPPCLSSSLGPFSLQGVSQLISCHSLPYLFNRTGCSCHPSQVGVEVEGWLDGKSEKDRLRWPKNIPTPLQLSSVIKADSVGSRSLRGTWLSF